MVVGEKLKPGIESAWLNARSALSPLYCLSSFYLGFLLLLNSKLRYALIFSSAEHRVPCTHFSCLLPEITQPSFLQHTFCGGYNTLEVNISVTQSRCAVGVESHWGTYIPSKTHLVQGSVKAVRADGKMRTFGHMNKTVR